MGRILAVVGVVVVIVALLIHFVVKGITLFPHAALIIGIVGAVIFAAGAFMMRPGSAK